MYTVQSVLKSVQEEGNWEVLFLGANLDTAAFARSAGIKLNNTTEYEYTKKGVLDGIVAASYATSVMRGVTLNVNGSAMNADNFDMTRVYQSVKNGELSDVAPTTTTTIKTTVTKSTSQ
jgi:hypothetical protein